MSRSGAVSLNVGGFRYVLERSDIQKYPGSFLECLLKDEWRQGDAEVISVERDGRLFKYVSAFLMCGQLPRDEKGYIDIALDVLEKLREEADFYGLQDLLKECELFRRTPESEKITNYMTMRTYLERLGDDYGYLDEDVVVECAREKTTKLLSALTSIHSPFCLVGRVSEFPTNFLFKQSTCSNLDVHELISAASQSAFGRGLETVTDLSFRESFEIVAENLNESTLAKLAEGLDITNFAPHLHLSLEPYKLVIYKEGGHFDAHRDTVRGDGHIGTLVVILNSTYTGGELEVTHGGRTEVVTGPYSWVAMYGDCLHKINPVTSGTRVSLIYDVCATPRPMLHSGVRVRKSKYYTSVWNSSALDVDAHKARGVSKNAASHIRALISKELRKTNTLYVSLHRMYPEYLNAQLMAQPGVLTRGDRTLYDILTHDNRYDVSFKLVTVFSTSIEWITYQDEVKHICTPSAQLFPDSFNESNPALTTPFTADSFLLYMRQNEKIRLSAHAKLIVAASPAEECTMYFRESAEWTGTESLPGMVIYVLRALQVRKKTL